MTSRRLIWKLLLAIFVAGALASLGAWAIVASTMCSNPRIPVPETQHVIPYNCHGMTVFVSELQIVMLHWLIPLFAVLGLIAIAMFVLAVATVRVDVQIHVSDTSKSS